MKFKSEIIKEVISEGESYSDPGYKLVWDSGWIADYKGENQDYVFEYKEKFYMISDRRTGSSFTEWYYDSSDWRNEIECYEVKKVPITTYVWERV